MKVVVTGGAGYVGSVTAARLLECGHEVTVYDDLSRGHRRAVPDGAAFVLGDIRDVGRVRETLRRHGCEAVVHMAALAEVAESVMEPERYHDVNVHGTQAVISAARSAGVDRIVFSSTAAVYGDPTRVPIVEDDALAPTNPYGWSKLAGERLLAAAQDAGDLSFTALRYFNACGADAARGEDHDPESHLIPVALRCARDGTALRVFGVDYPTADGTCVRDYVHVVDLADGHVQALERTPDGVSVLNLGGGGGASVRQVLECVEEVAGLAVRRETSPRRPGDPASLIASNARAGAVLGWRPRRTLEDAVRDAWEWMRLHPNGYPT
jgi:UDP-glucose 4-epimerase